MGVMARSCGVLESPQVAQLFEKLIQELMEFAQEGHNSCHYSVWDFGTSCTCLCDY